jgi:hypothetical protein
LIGCAALLVILNRDGIRFCLLLTLSITSFLVAVIVALQT